MIVVDASLATKWLLEEPDSGLAIAFLKRQENHICGPDLLATEVSGAVIAAANSRRITKDLARALLGAWLRKVAAGALQLQALDARRLEHAADIALGLGHPLPDCLYLALALDIRADLVTCDAQFASKARGLYPSVKLFSDCDI